jgi:hypothetical protein
VRYDDSLQLVVDGVPFDGEHGLIGFATQAMVHDIPDEGPAMSRVLGPKSFTILIAEPSDRLYALVDSGEQMHEVKVIANSYSITHPTHFHKGWVGADGVRKMFGSLAPDREREAKWVKEQPVGASTDRAEGM